MQMIHNHISNSASQLLSSSWLLNMKRLEETVQDISYLHAGGMTI